MTLTVPAALTWTEPVAYAKRPLPAFSVMSDSEEVLASPALLPMLASVAIAVIVPAPGACAFTVSAPPVTVLPNTAVNVLAGTGADAGTGAGAGVGAGVGAGAGVGVGVGVGVAGSAAIVSALLATPAPAELIACTSA